MIIGFLTMLFFSVLIKAQDKKPVEIQKEEDPYPITNEVSSEMAVFLSTIEEFDVGNLNFYIAPGEVLPTDYYFTGTRVLPTFYPLFEPEIRQKLVAEEIDLYAVGKIKGGAGQDLIMRIEEDGSHSLVLFQMRNDMVAPAHTLAYAACGAIECRQREAWLTDLDGDADLDLLIKQRSNFSASRQKEKPKITVLRKEEDGIFREVADWRKIGFDPGQYLMQNL